MGRTTRNTPELLFRLPFRSHACLLFGSRPPHVLRVRVRRSVSPPSVSSPQRNLPICQSAQLCPALHAHPQPGKGTRRHVRTGQCTAPCFSDETCTCCRTGPAPASGMLVSCKEVSHAQRETTSVLRKCQNGGRVRVLYLATTLGLQDLGRCYVRTRNDDGPTRACPDEQNKHTRGVYPQAGMRQ